MTRLRKLFASCKSRPVARQVRLGLESFDQRLVPSVTFTEDTAAHSVTVTTGAHQDDTVTIRNDGDGNLRITVNGTTRNFAHITDLRVNTGDGKDTVTYNQGAAGHEVDIHRSFHLSADLERLGLFDTDSNQDKFTANVFGDVGQFVNGAWQARTLDLEADADRLDFHLTDTDVHHRSTLFVHGYAPTITLTMDGEVDGNLALYFYGSTGDDSIDVNILLDEGSTGSVGGGDSCALVDGAEGSDHLRFAVREAGGSHAYVYANLYGGDGVLGWPDQDVGRHTANVQVKGLEQDVLVV